MRDSEKVADLRLLTDFCAPFRSVVQTSDPCVSGLKWTHACGVVCMEVDFKVRGLEGEYRDERNWTWAFARNVMMRYTYTLLGSGFNCLRQHISYYTLRLIRFGSLVGMISTYLRRTRLVHYMGDIYHLCRLNIGFRV